MYTNNYTFASANVIKILLKDSEGKVLLVQEPETNNWMPNHWGLPGGKPTETESLMETFARKSKTDVGQELKCLGLIKIEEIIMNGRTVLMFIVLAETESNDVTGEGANYKWVSKDDVTAMSVNEFTECYNKDLLINFFDGEYSVIPFGSVFNTLEFYKMGSDEDYQSWLKSGSK